MWILEWYDQHNSRLATGNLTFYPILHVVLPLKTLSFYFFFSIERLLTTFDTLFGIKTKVVISTLLELKKTVDWMKKEIDYFTMLMNLIIYLNLNFYVSYVVLH